jgi:glycosyltransferase involved in cell wall biosynthesis
MMTKQKHMLQVEGWRGISHSYALVNQFQLLKWNQSDEVLVGHKDTPFLMPHWSATNNSSGFSPQDLEIINASTQVEPQAIYKIFAPFELKAHPKLRTVTFGVTEFGFANGSFTPEQVHEYQQSGGIIHTPSQWSKSRMVANGINENLIHVVPHGADENYFNKLPQELVEQQRATLGYREDDVILLNIGTYLWNKGLDILINAFSKARKKNKNLKLLLKDQSSTYNISSNEFIKKILIENNDIEAINEGAIKILSGNLNLHQLNLIYNVSDYYVTPYRAEGFNLPALEAAVTGTKVISTKGGATDDFLHGFSHISLQGMLYENKKLSDKLVVNAYIEPDLGFFINVLSDCNRVEKGYYTERLFGWSDSCRSLNHLLFG